jgi:hypothetical protein
MPRRNELVNSFGAASSGGLWTGWAINTALTRTPAYELVAGTVGSTAQHWTMPAKVGDAGAAALLGPMTAVGSFAPGGPATLSLDLKMVGALANGVQLQLLAYNAAAGYLGQFSQAVSLTAAFGRFSCVYASLPATTSRVRAVVQFAYLNAAETGDVTFDRGQIEKRSEASAYIWTTTTPRNAPVAAPLLMTGVL